MKTETKFFLLFFSIFLMGCMLAAFHRLDNTLIPVPGVVTGKLVLQVSRYKSSPMVGFRAESGRELDLEVSISTYERLDVGEPVTFNLYGWQVHPVSESDLFWRIIGALSAAVGLFGSIASILARIAT